MFPTSSSTKSLRMYDRHDEEEVFFRTGDNGEEYQVFRHLAESRGQAVLTFMYLCVLGLCFTTAVVYFCRMQWEERYLRRLREHELSAIRSAMAQSENTQREESRAVQRKYIEERRARILQLFAPVRMTLGRENFPVSQEETIIGEDETNKGGVDNDATETTPRPDIEQPSENAYGDEDSLMVEIPAPGLHLRLGPNEKPPNRLVSGMCTVCLCTFEIGSDVVWSSNENCEHVFHQSCIENWVMKQREGPLCPCCRRDFIVDPYDIETNNSMLDAETSDVVAENSSATNSTLLQELFLRGADGPNTDERP